jgi:phosphoribosyl-ATP pyrophosphohydrolase
MSDVLARLEATIRARAESGDTTGSHTARLLAKGPEKCAEKFGEEAIEAIIEAVKGDREKLAAETADVLYHMLVMLASRGVSLADALAVLEGREGRSGVAEKATRNKNGT